MAYGLGMIRAPACQNRGGNILTLFAPRQQEPQAPFSHCPPTGTPPELVFGTPCVLGTLRGSRWVRGHFGVLLLRAGMRARAWGWKHPGSGRG